jgi:hypothetical protein
MSVIFFLAPGPHECSPLTPFSFNKKQRMEQRYLKFNVDQLCDVAARAAGPKLKCIDIVKIGKGAMNKVFLLTMDGNSQVIARLLCPGVAYPAHYSTASEVATMTFLRDKHQVPISEAFPILLRM